VVRHFQRTGDTKEIVVFLDVQVHFYYLFLIGLLSAPGYIYIYIIGYKVDCTDLKLWQNFLILGSIGWLRLQSQS
jgi:hypothetical protein